MTNTATSLSTTPGSLPTSIPLIVGVTGHRDLVAEDVSQIKGVVREVLQTLKTTYPHTPLVVLSPLVEGADQLVAEVALEEDFVARMVAVLCWPPEFSFGAPVAAEALARGGDAARFKQLLDRAANVVTMPLDDVARSLADSSPAAFEERQQELVGKFIARHSQMLIALWDGQASESSGTARVVDWQRNGAPAPFAAQLGELDVVEGAPICHILVRRKSRIETSTASGSSAPEYLYPTSAESPGHQPEHQIHRAWGNIDRFNRDVAELRKTIPETISTSRRWVLPNEIQNRLTPPLRELLEYYALADATALSFQNRVKSLVRWLFVIGPAALVSLEVYAHLWPHWVALAGYFVLLACGYWIFQRARRAEWEGRYLDNRALAEALRVQFFWRWAGLTDCAAEHYLRHLRGELGWIRQASRTCFLLTSNSSSVPPGSSLSNSIVPGSEESLNAVLQYWIHDQTSFFKKKAPLNEHLESNCERIIKWFFRVALAIAAVELAVHWTTSEANHLLIVLTFFCLVTVALAEKIAEYHTFGILARQYEWMKNLFNNAAVKLETLLAARNVPKSQALIHDLGLEALNENADWLVQRRRKPVVLPK